MVLFITQNMSNKINWKIMEQELYDDDDHLGVI